eukprot:s2433_g16.t1
MALATAAPATRGQISEQMKLSVFYTSSTCWLRRCPQTCFRKRCDRYDATLSILGRVTLRESIGPRITRREAPLGSWAPSSRAGDSRPCARGSPRAVWCQADTSKIFMNQTESIGVIS